MWTGRKLITFIGPIWHEHKYPYLYNSTSIDDITMTSSGVVFRLNKAPPEPQNNVLELFPQCGYFLILTSLEWWWTCAIKRQKMFRRRRRQFYRLGSAAKVWPVLRHLLDSSAGILRRQLCNITAQPARASYISAFHILWSKHILDSNFPQIKSQGVYRPYFKLAKQTCLDVCLRMRGHSITESQSKKDQVNWVSWASKLADAGINLSL